MHYGLYMPNFGSYADVRALAALARDAEQAGWEGFFLWDHISPSAAPERTPMCDPFIALTAIALATERIRIGTLVTPLARRRPWVLARQIATLDQVSNGRVTLGVGLGFPAEEYTSFGEPGDARVRAEKLDEALDILAGLLSGQPFSHEGKHYHIEQTRFLPACVQAKIPIWVAGEWPNKPPMRRAARWDGAFPIHADPMPLTHAEVRAVRDYVATHRTRSAPFDLVLRGDSGDAGPFALKDPPASYEAHGATWWLETLTDWRGTFSEMCALVRNGPAR